MLVVVVAALVVIPTGLVAFGLVLIVSHPRNPGEVTVMIDEGKMQLVVCDGGARIGSAVIEKGDAPDGVEVLRIANDDPLLATRSLPIEEETDGYSYVGSTAFEEAENYFVSTVWDTDGMPVGESMALFVPSELEEGVVSDFRGELVSLDEWAERNLCDDEF